jgi:hypothetical protein
MKKFILIVIMIAVIAGSVFAQSIIGVSIPGGWTSPQGQATQGRIRSWADDFIRPDAYNNLQFTNWYGLVSFDKTSRAALGFATNIKEGFYLGAFYYGSFWANVSIFDYDEGRKNWLGNDKDGVWEYTSVPGFPSTAADQPSNQLAVIVGVADMGFRLSFRSTHQAFSIKEDSLVDGTPYKSYSIEMGLISPQLAWSMTKNLVDGKGIKPYVTLDLDFNRDYGKAQEYKNNVIEERIIRSNNSFVPKLGLGFGGLTIAEKESFRATLDLDYALAIGIFNNEYNYTPDDGAPTKANSIGTINGVVSGGSYYEINYNSHIVTPSIAGSWNSDKLRLRFKLNLNMSLQGGSYTENRLEYASTSKYVGLQKDGKDGSYSVFNLNPDLRLAAQWQVAPKLALNAGGRINLRAYSWIQDEGKEFDEGKEAANSSYKSVYSGFGVSNADISSIINDRVNGNSTSSDSRITNQLTLGVTLNATDNLGIEATCGVDNNNIINVFDFQTEGLFTFINLLVTLKF